jgi:hypothetical protein
MAPQHVFCPGVISRADRQSADKTTPRAKINVEATTRVRRKFAVTVDQLSVGSVVLSNRP